MQEPPPVKQVKPLPKPDDAPRKKRGGRRYAIIMYKHTIVQQGNVNYIPTVE